MLMIYIYSKYTRLYPRGNAGHDTSPLHQNVISCLLLSCKQNVIVPHDGIFGQACSVPPLRSAQNDIYIYNIYKYHIFSN